MPTGRRLEQFPGHACHGFETKSCAPSSSLKITDALANLRRHLAVIWTKRYTFAIQTKLLIGKWAIEQFAIGGFWPRLGWSALSFLAAKRPHRRESSRTICFQKADHRLWLSLFQEGGDSVFCGRHKNAFRSDCGVTTLLSEEFERCAYFSCVCRTICF